MDKTYTRIIKNRIRANDIWPDARPKKLNHRMPYEQKG